MNVIPGGVPLQAHRNPVLVTLWEMDGFIPYIHSICTFSFAQITVIFKPYEDCTEQKVYQAVTDDLPAAFTDGTVSGGDGETRSLWIVEKVPGRHVEIQAGYTGVTVVVRQLGRYLTLATRVPEELAMAYDESQDLQLCVNGCPAAERIDRDGHLPLPVLHLQQPPRAGANPSFTLESATAKCCESLEVRDIYFNSCVFDLLTTGDANFTSAAYNALKDMETLHPKRERWHIFPRGNAACSHVPSVPFPLILGFLIPMLF